MDLCLLRNPEFEREFEVGELLMSLRSEREGVKVGERAEGMKFGPRWVKVGLSREEEVEATEDGEETESEDEGEEGTEKGDAGGDKEEEEEDTTVKQGLRRAFNTRKTELDCATVLMGMRYGGLAPSELKRKRIFEPRLDDDGPVVDGVEPAKETPTTNGCQRTSTEEDTSPEEGAPPTKRARSTRVQPARNARTAAQATPEASATNGRQSRQSRAATTAQNGVNGTRSLTPSPLRQSTSPSDKEAEDARLMPPPALPNGVQANGRRSHARPSTNGNVQTPTNGDNTASSSTNGVASEAETPAPTTTKSGRVVKPTAKGKGGSG
ncbi:MAG: hypothetical protein M1812_002725 [Candelaria pacifica]|nr:MAG: hypothetical protein M1812_002725 [Candelaria pacifica]